MHTYPFEKLRVWQKSMDLTTAIYKLTDSFPSQEKFGIISQLRRAAASVGANIAEGSSRFSEKEKIRFYEIAYGSLIEVLNHLILSQKLDFVTTEKYLTIRTEIEELSKSINALVQTIKKNKQ